MGVSPPDGSDGPTDEQVRSEASHDDGARLAPVVDRARERRLLPRLKQAQAAAWTELYEWYAPELYRRVLMPRLANRAAAEDALSETFAAAIERISQYQERGVSFYSWLARIAHNKAMDMHRARAMTGRKIADLTQTLEALVEPLADGHRTVELNHDSGVIRQRITATLDALNPRYARAIELRLVQEKSRQDCAKLLDVKVGTFDVLLLRATRAFTATWHELYGVDSERRLAILEDS